MVISTVHFLISIVVKQEAAEHLIPNIRKFDVVYCMSEELKGGRPAEKEGNITRVQVLCSRGKLNEIMGYVKEYYVKGFGAVYYYEEVNVPM